MESKIVQKCCFFRGKRHDNKILKVKILLSRNFVVVAQAPTLTEFRGERELGDFLSAYDLCAKANSPSFFAEFVAELSEFSLPKQYSRRTGKMCGWLLRDCQTILLSRESVGHPDNAPDLSAPQSQRYSCKPNANSDAQTNSLAKFSYLGACARLPPHGGPRKTALSH